jgi:hypothetical protein
MEIIRGGHTEAHAPQPRHFEPSIVGRPRNRLGAGIGANG